MKTITYRLTTNTLDAIKALTKELRRAGGDKDMATKITKVISLLKKTQFDTPYSEGMVEAYTGKQPTSAVEEVVDYLFQNIEVEVEEVTEDTVVQEPKEDETKGSEMEKDIEVPEVEVGESSYNARYDFMNKLVYNEMTAHQLGLVLFKELGAEVESKTRAMSTGAKIKFDLLDDLKEKLVELYPEIRVEVLEAKLANALAVTKLKEGTSLAVVEGNLAVYNYLATDLTTDSKNFEFMAKIGVDKTKALDILILQSTFATYKEEIERGNLPMTSNELNLAIARAITGVEPVKQSTLDKIKNLF